MKWFFVVFVFAASVSGDDLMNRWKKECAKSYTSSCFKMDFIGFVDRISDQDSIGILPGVSVIKQNVTSSESTNDVVANLARDFPNDADKRMDAYLMHKIGSYLSNHAISIKLFDPKTFDAARNFNVAALGQLGVKEEAMESARKKDKGGNGMMAGLMMMKGTLGALGFGALAMLAGKALMTGLMALMLSAIVGLKHLAGGEKKTTYEIVSKPVYASAHAHSSEEHHGGYMSAGYARAMNDDTAGLVREAIKSYANVRQRRMAW